MGDTRKHDPLLLGSMLCLLRLQMVFHDSPVPLHIVLVLLPLGPPSPPPRTFTPSSALNFSSVPREGEFLAHIGLRVSIVSTQTDHPVIQMNLHTRTSSHNHMLVAPCQDHSGGLYSAMCCATNTACGASQGILSPC